MHWTRVLVVVVVCFFVLFFLFVCLFLTQPKLKKLYLQEVSLWKHSPLTQSWPCFLRIQVVSWEFNFSGYKMMWQCSQPHLSIDVGKMPTCPVFLIMDKQWRGCSTFHHFKGFLCHVVKLTWYTIENNLKRFVSILLHS